MTAEATIYTLTELIEHYIMGWLDTIRTLLGFDSDDRGKDRSTVAITVEKEPDATSERAVKEPVDSADADGRESTGDEDETREIAPEEDDGSEVEETASAGDGESEGEETTPEAGDEAEPDDGEGVTLTDIQGIGSAYADRLEKAGIADVDALAAADPENLAERANISTKRIQRWIDRATDR